jgi:ssDNA-binding Zn-finger/Zn-ribbon topoisomerase 1
MAKLRASGGYRALHSFQLTTDQSHLPEVLCPKCSKLMVLRTARSSGTAGYQFWGCSDFPACKGKRNL